MTSDRRSGSLRVIDHDAESVEDTREALIRRVARKRGVDLGEGALHTDSLDGFFDDLVDDVFEWIGDGLSTVADIVVSAVKATITFVVDGITRIVNAFLDAVGSIPIIAVVIATVLNFAGAVVGRVVG